MSAYRFRYARYCLVWFFCLGAALAAFLALRPSVEGSTAPLAVMFLFVGLPLGTATALVAAVGFALGGGWAALIARSPAAALWWPKVRETLAVVVLAPVVVFALYMFTKGFLTLQVRFPSRRNSYSVHWATEPLGFVVALGIWGVLGVGLAVYLFRRLRRAYATQPLQRVDALRHASHASGRRASRT